MTALRKDANDLMQRNHNDLPYPCASLPCDCLLAPQDGGGGLQRAIARQNTPPREERED